MLYFGPEFLGYPNEKITEILRKHGLSMAEIESALVRINEFREERSKPVSYIVYKT